MVVCCIGLLLTLALEAVYRICTMMPHRGEESREIEIRRECRDEETKILNARRDIAAEVEREAGFASALTRMRDSLATQEGEHAGAEKAVTVGESREVFLGFVAQVFSPRGVRSYALDRGLEGVNETLREVSQSLFGGDFSLSLSSTKDKKDGSESNVLDIVFDNAGGSYKSSSGGERRKVDIALQLAMSVLARRTGCGSTNLLVGDEVLDSLDATASGFALQALESVASQGKTVYVISHDLGVQSLVGDILFVEKRDGVSSLVEER